MEFLRSLSFDVRFDSPVRTAGLMECEVLKGYGYPAVRSAYEVTLDFVDRSVVVGALGFRSSGGVGEREGHFFVLESVGEEDLSTAGLEVRDVVEEVLE